MGHISMRLFLWIALAALPLATACDVMGPSPCLDLTDGGCGTPRDTTRTNTTQAVRSASYGVRLTTYEP